MILLSNASIRLLYNPIGEDPVAKPRINRLLISIPLMTMLAATCETSS